MNNFTLFKAARGNLCMLDLNEVDAVDFYSHFNADSKSHFFMVYVHLKSGTNIDLVICDSESEAQDFIQQFADYLNAKEFYFND